MLKPPVLLIAAMAALPNVVRAEELPSYEAAYEIRLIHASESKGPRAASGSSEIHVDKTCDGWETKAHTLIDLTFGDSLRVTNERFFSSWESAAGDNYRFAVQTQKNGNTVEAFKGTASVGKAGGQAIYEPLSDPAKGAQGKNDRAKQTTLALPAGTLFPEAHTRALLEHAHAGEAFFRSVVLTGAASKGPRTISVAIGPRLTDNSDNLQLAGGDAIDSKLLSAPGWQLSMAAFNLNEQRDTPNFEMSFQFHDTGVVPYYEQTFGDFTISATLTSLRPIASACGQK